MGGEDIKSREGWRSTSDASDHSGQYQIEIPSSMPTSESYRFKVGEGEGVRQAKVVNQRGRRGIEDVRWGEPR